MAVAKSPFYIIRNFLSPKQCDVIIDKLRFYEPDVDTEGNPLKMIRHEDESETLIFSRFEPLIPQLEEYYDYSHLGTEKISFEYYPQGCETEPLCENSNWVNKKWIRTKNRDISCILFLSQYNKNPDFETDFEIYGGLLGFHSFNFSFHPERGTLIVYPSGPHFINSTSPIKMGDLFQARFHLQGKLPYIYQPDKFPGADNPLKNWFQGLHD